MSSKADAIFQIRQCFEEACRFRFPVRAGSEAGAVCPQCGGETVFVTEQFGSHVVERPISSPTRVIEGLLDNIRSAFNVGAIFRTADAAAVSCLHLCGMTAKPENARVAKTALGAEKNVSWVYYNNAVDAAARLKAKGYCLWGIEGGEQAESLFEETADLPEEPILLIVGNEVSGIDPGLLALCDRVLAIPMYGRKTSLNVEVAFGIAVYHLGNMFDSRPTDNPV
jgi:tRNA G18 (ribose-2'-O)-methylase SpoU